MNLQSKLYPLFFWQLLLLLTLCGCGGDSPPSVGGLDYDNCASSKTISASYSVKGLIEQTSVLDASAKAELDKKIADVKIEFEAKTTTYTKREDELKLDLPSKSHIRISSAKASDGSYALKIKITDC